MNNTFGKVFLLNLLVPQSFGFTAQPHVLSQTKPSSMVRSATIQSEAVDRFCKARELLRSLIEEDKCFSEESGAMAFGDVCASNCVYEDCFEPQPFVGKRVSLCLA